MALLASRQIEEVPFYAFLNYIKSMGLSSFTSSYLHLSLKANRSVGGMILSQFFY